MIKEIIDTFKSLTKINTLKLIDFSLSLIKGFAIKVEYFEKKDKKK